MSVALTWRPVEKDGQPLPADLDLSVLAFDEHLSLCDVVYFRNLRSLNGYMSLDGDDRCHDRFDGSETVVIDLSQCPRHTFSFAVLVSAFDTTLWPQSARLTLSEYFPSTPGAKLAPSPPRKIVECAFAVTEHCASLAVAMYRKGGHWLVRPIGRALSDSHPVAAVDGTRHVIANLCPLTSRY